MNSREVIPTHPIAGEIITEMLNAKDEDFLRLKTSMERLANEAETLRAKVVVLEEYKSAVIDHFIDSFHVYDDSKNIYDNLSLLIAYYQELALDPKVSKEASDLRAKVASADVLVEALETIATESHPELWQVEVAIKALATYDKSKKDNSNG